MGVAGFAVVLAVAQWSVARSADRAVTERAQRRRAWIVEQLRFDERLLAELTRSSLLAERGCRLSSRDSARNGPLRAALALRAAPGPLKGQARLPPGAPREGIAHCGQIWQQRPPIDFSMAERAAAAAPSGSRSEPLPSPVRPLTLGLGQALVDLLPVLARLVAALLGLVAIAAAAGATGSLATAWSPRRRWALRGGAGLVLVATLLPMLRPALFHVRTASPGGFVGQVLFVTVFAGAALRVAVRPLLDPGPAQAFLQAARGRAAPALAARRAAADACELLLPFVPAATVAALLMQVKAVRPSGAVGARGMGELILDLIHATGRHEALGIGLLVLASLLLLVFAGHALLRELRFVFAPARLLRREPP